MFLTAAGGFVIKKLQKAITYLPHEFLPVLSAKIKAHREAGLNCQLFNMES
jgi:hypothetical protein